MIYKAGVRLFASIKMQKQSEGTQAINFADAEENAGFLADDMLGMLAELLGAMEF